MQKISRYPGVDFDGKALKKIVAEFRALSSDPAKEHCDILSVTKGTETIKYDSLDEFISAVNSKTTMGGVAFMMTGDNLKIHLNTYAYAIPMPASVEITSKNRDLVARLGNIVDECALDCKLPPPPPKLKPPRPKPKIFIGHGGSQQWRDLKDHLHELHNYEVLAYETGERAGHTIRDVIESMLSESSFAVLVMTGEDEQPDGTSRARQNVIHEIGLFQGRLGFTKAIVLLEEGTVEFSNIHGVNQIRYPKGAIRQTYGDVLAVLKRELEND